MKLSLLFTSLLLSSLASASSQCFGEAQITATITSVKRTDAGECFSYVDESSVRHYSPNLMCPLDFSDFRYAGIFNKMLDGETQECEYQVGDEVSGVIVKSREEYITLEKK